MADITANIAFKFRVQDKVGEDAFASLRDYVVGEIQRGMGWPAIEKALKLEVEQEYMQHTYGWLLDEGLDPKLSPKNRKGQWKYDSFTLPVRYLHRVKERGGVVLQVNADLETIKVEAMPNHYKSGVSVLKGALNRSVEAGWDHTKIIEAMKDGSKGDLNKLNRPEVVVPDPTPEDLLKLARNLDRLDKDFPSLYSDDLELVLTGIINRHTA